MEGLTEEEMCEKVDKRTERVERKQSELGEDPSQSVASGHGWCALDARTAAVYSVLLGEFEQARELFATEADHRRSGAAMRLDPDVEVSELGQIFSAPFEIVEGLYAALLSGDDETLTRVAETILAMEQHHQYQIHDGSVHTVEIDEDRYRYAEVLAALAAGADERVVEENRQLHEVVDEDATGRPIRFAAMARYADGILDGNLSDVEAAVNRVLERHVNTIAGGQRTSDELVCVEATGMMVLARRRGLDVAVDSEYIPEEYVEWLLTDRRGV